MDLFRPDSGDARRAADKHETAENFFEKGSNPLLRGGVFGV
jgi:hypothetical protein